jgi:MFS family permease
VPVGQLLANALLFLLAAVQNEQDFQAWGWRIPFLLSAVLVLIGLYIRLSIEESPVFQEAQARAAERVAAGEREIVPIVDVFRRYPREVFTAMGARFAENVSYYIFTIVITTYMTKRLGMTNSFVLGAVLIGTGVHLIVIPVWGALSDRFGRKPIYLVGAAGVGVWAFAFIALIDTTSFALTTLAVIGGLVFHAAMYGPQAAFLSEMFGTKVRYSGTSVGYQLASVVAGGLAPIVAVALYTSFDSGYAVAVYVALSALLTIVAVATYGETRHRDLADDHAVAPAR